MKVQMRRMYSYLLTAFLCAAIAISAPETEDSDVNYTWNADFFPWQDPVIIALLAGSVSLPHDGFTVIPYFDPFIWNSDKISEIHYGTNLTGGPEYKAKFTWTSELAQVDLYSLKPHSKIIHTVIYNRTSKSVNEVFADFNNLKYNLKFLRSNGLVSTIEFDCQASRDEGPDNKSERHITQLIKCPKIASLGDSTFTITLSIDGSNAKQHDRTISYKHVNGISYLIITTLSKYYNYEYIIVKCLENGQFDHAWCTNDPASTECMPKDSFLAKWDERGLLINWKEIISYSYNEDGLPRSYEYKGKFKSHFEIKDGYVIGGNRVATGSGTVNNSELSSYEFTIYYDN